MADSTLQVGFETQGTAVVVSPQGEIGYSEATVFRTWLRKAHDAKTPRVVVDLSKVDYMNTPGVATKSASSAPAALRASQLTKGRMQ